MLLHARRWALVVAVTSGCSDPSGAADAGPGGGDGDAAAPTSDGPPPDGFGDYRYLCDLEPPVGSTAPPPPPAYSGGDCPVLVAGRNTLRSGGRDRQFILVLPDALEPGEQLPLGFLWHPLGSDAGVFLEEGDLMSAVNAERFAAALPEARGDLQLQWPWTGIDGEARVDEELRFFDDMFACISRQFPIKLHCVSNGGVSSGALWAMQVGWRRGQFFSSLLSASGGSGDGSVVKQWEGSPHIMPVFVLWGGPEDACFLFNFTDTSQDLEQALAADGHFMVECIHNCGHAVPPFDPPAGKSRFSPLWEFVLDHPYWLRDGQSPYAERGIPADFPAWCGIGPGSATPRTGACADPSKC